MKIYDKQKHYSSRGFHIPNEVMRFEIKYRRQHLCSAIRKKGAISLQNVLDYGLPNFKFHLLKEWENILYYDFTTLDPSPYKERYSNPNFWLSLKRENFKYHRKNLNALTAANRANLKNQIKNLIAQKMDLLSNQTTQIQTLYI